MSRSNGSQPQPTGQAPQAGGYDVNPDPRAWNPRQPVAPQQAAAQHQAAPQLQTAQQRPAQQPQAGYADPYAQHAGYYQAQTTPQTAGRPAQPLSAGAAGYAPQFDPYVPAQGYQSAAPAGAYQTQQPTASAPFPDLRGSTFDQWAGHQQPPADPRGYDLASYGGSHDPQQAYAPTRSPQIVPQQQASRAQTAEWPQPHAQYSQQGYDAYQQAEAQMQLGAQDYGLAAGQQDLQQAQGYDETYAADGSGETLEDESPSGRRGFLIAATLAGAIFVGGGLTYAYNALLGPGAGGVPPLVKSASGPAKVKPSEPGGKQFDHADSKVLGRLNDNGTVAASSGTDASGSKKVATLVVKPDGTIEPPAAAEPPAEPVATVGGGQTLAPIAGMSVVSVGGAPESAASAAPEAKPTTVATATAPATTAAPVSSQKPLVVSPPAAAPKAPVMISEAAAGPAGAAPSIASLVETAAVAPAPAVKKPAVVKKAVVATAAVPATAAPTGAGYMAVIASVPASAKSRMDALTRWADMQQKYGTILQSKTMDVQEANLGEKGTYHRLLVGPPGSKDTASTVCSQLKAAGHADCWVMAY